jgi:hypothetical protein
MHIHSFIHSVGQSFIHLFIYMAVTLGQVLWWVLKREPPHELKVKALYPTGGWGSHQLM